MGEHINEQDEFQSDKYPWCKPGFVPLKLTDPMARPALWDYARCREEVDKEFTEDLRTCLIVAGYEVQADLNSSDELEAKVKYRLNAYWERANHLFDILNDCEFALRGPSPDGYTLEGVVLEELPERIRKMEAENNALKEEIAKLQ